MWDARLWYALPPWPLCQNVRRVIREPSHEAKGQIYRISSGSSAKMDPASIDASRRGSANGRGRLDERLARWLLMWDDRIRPEHITVTHDFLALLLGVRRPSVTDTMHDLEVKGLICSSRGKVLLLNREGLKLAANGFYGVPEAEYDRALGTAGGLYVGG